MEIFCASFSSALKPRFGCVHPVRVPSVAQQQQQVSNMTPTPASQEHRFFFPHPPSSVTARVEGVEPATRKPTASRYLAVRYYDPSVPKRGSTRDLHGNRSDARKGELTSLGTGPKNLDCFRSRFLPGNGTGQERCVILKNVFCSSAVSYYYYLWASLPESKF